MIRRFLLRNFIFLVCFYTQAAQDVKMSEILQNYQQAFKKLLIAHSQNPEHKDQMIFSDPFIVATYQKLIAPSVSWINGYARVVFSEIVRKFPYEQDLHRLTVEYEQHRKAVQKIILLLPKNVQAQALEMFHESLIDIVGQTCFNLVQQLTNQNTVDNVSLTAAHEAYNLIWKIKTKTMKLHGAALEKDFEIIITQNMTTLFSNAIALAQNSLASSMSSNVSVQEIYKNLEQYYTVLYQVYTNSGDTANATLQQNLLSALKIAQKNYNQAKKEEEQATAFVQNARVAIVLDLSQATAVLASIDASIKTLQSAVELYESAQQSFQNANDTIGATVCTTLQSEINDGDILLRVIQKLWGLYLNDQSETAGFYTFPTLQQFVNGQAAGDSANAVQAIQNLISMCDSSSGNTNNVGSLISTIDSLLILPILKNALLFMEENPNFSEKNDLLFDVKLLKVVQTTISVLIDWANALIDATNNSDQAAIAQSMGYAKLLDGLWEKNLNLDQYVPYLPDALSSDETWINFTAQFLYQAGLVSSAADAQALLKTANVALPAQLTAQDLAMMKNKADTYFAQAEAFEKAENFVQATTAYEKAMTGYQKLYQQESTGMEQIKMLELANLAKTRFAACSFGSTVQNSGSATLGQILKIPTSYIATNYQLSFDSTLMGSALPTCLSSLTAGQTLTTLSAADKKDLFVFVKGYLVAQKMMDLGMISNDGSPSFTDYFSDYTLNEVVQSSNRAQSAINQISNYLNNFENVGVSAVTLNSANQVTILLQNWPLESLTPPCSTLSVAGTYFTAAVTLFASGSTPLTFGGQTYDPGNDESSQNLMLQHLGYVYLSAAQACNSQLTVLMQKFSLSMGMTTKGATVQKLPQGFSQQFTAIQNQAITLQALLYGSDNAAYGYFVQAGLSTIARKIKEEFLNVYKQQIAFAKKCLVGDPTTFDYQTVVTAINQAYVSWASELDQVKDVGLIAHINEQIAQMYEFAGQKCLNYSYELPSFPEISQKHYMITAQYYRSAQLQYGALQDLVKQKALTVKLNDIYYQACVQNLNLYLYVKQHGALYDSESQQKEIPISFTQLLQDFSNGSVGSGESTLYATVQRLLLDAAMVFEYLSNGLSNGAAATTQNPNHQVILTFLAKQGLIDADVVKSFSTVPMGATEKIIKSFAKNYSKFVANPAQFAALNELMFMMVKNIYMMDYQAITESSTSNEIALATQQFLSSISNEASNLQNPSAGYVG
ncbi:hypothetical protein KBB68_00675 [Candidatus Babeliales bacterium]|nr:hypothetical protein [Candidatus Babeliales bacterium]